jgi:glycosyltransferase involved in cell wall biosynthesis
MYIVSDIKVLLLRISDSLFFAAKNVNLHFKDSSRYPLVTIVVPLYNEQSFIADCLQTVRRQSYSNWECIIVDDASTDGSHAIVTKYCGADGRFRVIGHKKNLGLSASRNTGLREARGEYITFLDADDFLLPNSLWMRILPLLSDQTREVIGSYCKTVSTPERYKKWRVNLSHLKLAEAATLDFVQTMGECPFNAHSPILKTEHLRKFGGFNESMRHGAEDWELWGRVLRHGYRFVFSGSYGVGYRQKARSMVRSMPLKHVREAVRLIENAHRPLDNVEIADPPFVFRRPVSEYATTVLLAPRLIGYATMALLAGDKTAFEEIVSGLGKGSYYFLKYRIDFEDIIGIAYDRYHCITNLSYAKQPRQFMKLKREADRVIREIKGKIIELIDNP